MKDLLIVVTTWLPPGGEMQRLAAFEDALASWHLHLKFSGKIRIHIADDGSEFRGLEWRCLCGYQHNSGEGTLCMVCLRSKPDGFGPYATSIWGTTESRGNREGVGASLNRGFADARENEVVAYFVDDWQLLQDFDLDPWVKAFDDLGFLGFVRLGPPHPGCTGTIEPVPESDGEWLLFLNHHNFAFSFRPMLVSPRMWRDLGPFPEGESSLEAERIYNDKFCESSWRGALALPHPWDHIYTTELSVMRPEQAVRS